MEGLMSLWTIIFIALVINYGLFLYYWVETREDKDTFACRKKEIFIGLIPFMWVFIFVIVGCSIIYDKLTAETEKERKC